MTAQTTPPLAHHLDRRGVHRRHHPATTQTRPRHQSRTRARVEMMTVVVIQTRSRHQAHQDRSYRGPPSM